MMLYHITYIPSDKLVGDGFYGCRLAKSLAIERRAADAGIIITIAILLLLSLSLSSLLSLALVGHCDNEGP